MALVDPPEPFAVTLRDGADVRVRPIRPDDKAGLQAGLRELSSESRYRRFHTPLDHLTDEQLRYLTEIDYVDHMAWVAERVDGDGEPGVGVARYVRLRDEPEVAEAAITVADHYQGRGLGSLLLAVLSRSAIAHGIRVLRNYVLIDNAAMLAMLDELGATRVDEGDGVYRVDMPLPEDPDDLADTPATRVLRAAATRRLRPFRHLVARIRPHPPGR